MFFFRLWLVKDELIKLKILEISQYAKKQNILSAVKVKLDSLSESLKNDAVDLVGVLKEGDYNKGLYAVSTCNGKSFTKQLYTHSLPYHLYHVCVKCAVQR